MKKIDAKAGFSFREFVTDLVLRATEKFEDRKLAKIARKRIKEIDPKDNVSFHEAVKLAGWKRTKSLYKTKN